jgi:integrase
MPVYRIGKLHGEFVVTFNRDGKRHRYRLGTRDAREAERIAPAIYAELTRPCQKTIQALWDGYVDDMRGRPIVQTMMHTWKAIRPNFGSLRPDQVKRETCRAHVAARRAAGIKDGTIHTELGHLRMVLLWAYKGGLIASAPHIERPPKPPPRDRHLTRQEARALIEGARVPHVRLFILLALTTGARASAILGLTWDRCDFEREKINLKDPFAKVYSKGRAIVPMNRTAKAALIEMRQGAMTPFVIEWAGDRVRSIKKGMASAARAAVLAGVSPHVLRHSAAVHMIEDGIPMEEVAQYLGHKDVAVTRNIYARYSPNHLRRAASSLEYV